MLGRGVMTLVAEGILPEGYSGLERNNGGCNHRCGPRCPNLIGFGNTDCRAGD